MSSLNVLDCCAAFEVLIDGIIHVGANRANEYSSYRARTGGPLLYIEAIPEMAKYVATKLDPKRPHFVRQAVVSDTSGETVKFNVSSNDGLSSSMLELGRHAEIYPNVKYETALSLVTERLDDVVAERKERDEFNVLVIDVQGAEFKVLKGAANLLAGIDAIFAEVSSEPLYEGGCTFLEITNFLAGAGFVFRNANMNRAGWGDAFYSKRSTRLNSLLARSIARDKPARQSSYYDNVHLATSAVNGVLAADFSIHTAAADPTPWWEVDLGRITDIRRIIYLDRPKFESRAASLTISTSSDGADYQVAYRREGKRLDEIIDVLVRLSARFVRVGLEGGGPLHFRQLIIV
jgi:FkbM family methyltransferase